VEISVVDVIATEIYDGLNTKELIEELRQKEKAMELMQQVLKNVKIINECKKN